MDKGKGIEINAEVEEFFEDEIIETKETKQIPLRRTKFLSSDGKKYYKYFVESDIEFTTEKGEKKKRKIVANMQPKDIGGYENLDMLFEINSKPFLNVGQEVLVDSTGRKSKYTTYKVEVDFNGMVLSVSLKPFRDSDKSILAMMV